MPKKQL